MATLSASDLFDAAFLESIAHLRIVARRVAPAGRFAEHRSRDLGSGIEFSDYRPYVPGDDLRAIDWNIYRRLGRVFIRLFEELEDLPAYILVDASRSMFLETPPRAHAAMRGALALASISLNQHDRVGVFAMTDDLEVVLRPVSGKGRIMPVAERLAEVTATAEARAGAADGGTDFAATLERLRALQLREGLLVVVSDFFDPAGVERVIDALKLVRHRLLLVQLVRTVDRAPDVVGDVRFVDCETGGAEDVSVTSAVLERYRAAYDRFEERLTTFASSLGAGLLRLDADAPVVPQLATIFESGRYSA